MPVNFNPLNAPNRSLLTIVSVLLGGWLCVPVHAQTEAAARPKIGLVLSGGGARGIVHVGVLEWLEEHRIPVDVVTGTSMGGLVGGLYASGLTTKEMLALVDSADWNQALSGIPSYYDLSFRRKEDRRTIPSDIEFGFHKGKLQGRSGLNPGHEIELIFDRATLPYGNNTDFATLPIPFRCVATDMVAAKQVVMDKGSLSTALRATMSIPGVFTLYRRDGRLLGDGGLLNNIPTDIAQQMGADAIIAVNVSGTLHDADSLSTIAGVLSQSVTLMATEGRERNLKLANVVLAPDMERFDPLDFEKSRELVKVGHAIAAQNAAALEKYALPENEWRQYLAARAAKRRTAVPIPTFITVAGASKNGRPLVQQRLKRFVGKPIDTEKLEDELNQLRAQGGYDTLSYQLTGLDDPSGDPKRIGLVIQVREKPYSPPFVYPAVTLAAGSEQNSTDLSLVTRIVVPNLDTNGSEARIDLAAGALERIAGEFYRPVKKGDRQFVAARFSLDRSTQDVFDGGSRLAQYRVGQQTIALDTGYTFLRAEVRASYEITQLKATVRVGDSSLPNLQGNERSGQIRYTYDSQNSATIPTRGLRLQARTGWYFGSPGVASSFPQAELQTSTFYPLTTRDSLFVIASGGTSFGKEASILQQFSLGGPFRLTAYSQNELLGEQYLLGGVGFLHSIARLPAVFGKKVYFSGILERGSVSGGATSAAVRSSLSFGAAADTIIGPIAVGVSVGDAGKRAFYFSVGKLF